MLKRTDILRLIFVVALSFIFFLSIYSYKQINSLVETGKLVNHTAQVTVELEKVSNSLKDIGNGLGGYILTHDDRFLSSYSDEGLKKYPLHLTNLNNLTKDNPAQQQSLKVLARLAKDREKHMKKLIEVIKSRAPTTDELLEGKLIMDTVRIQVAKMTKEENSIMAQREEELKKQMAHAPVVLFYMSMIALIILVLSFWQLDTSLLKISQKEQEVKQKNLDLEKTNAELASFMYISSHDLQEPLRKIQLFSKRILEKEIHVLSPEGKSFFDRIENAAERMQQLIKDLLAYSKTSTDIKPLEKTDLNDLLEQVKQELHEQITASNVTIESERLPELDIIPFQFKQLFTNIISNAVKFAKPGIPLQIKIKYNLVDAININQGAKPNTKYHQISISDNGIGFDPGFNEQIFGLFQRLHERSEFEGTGIGLAICKKIVENHKGIITADGKETIGATFNIYMPAF